MKTDKSNWSLNIASANQALLFRNEATLQGIDPTSVLWECSSCFGNEKLITKNASDFEGEVQQLGFLPFEEASVNKTTANFVKYMKQIGDEATTKNNNLVKNVLLAVSVKEVYGEALVPLAKDMPFADALSLNGAVRYTDYSSSGSVVTWKVGATWDITEEFRLRGTRSSSPLNQAWRNNAS